MAGRDAAAFPDRARFMAYAARARIARTKDRFVVITPKYRT
jgi:hypothetical protein